MVALEVADGEIAGAVVLIGQFSHDLGAGRGGAAVQGVGIVARHIDPTQAAAAVASCEQALAQFETEALSAELDEPASDSRPASGSSQVT